MWRSTRVNTHVFQSSVVNLKCYIHPTVRQLRSSKRKWNHYLSRCINDFNSIFLVLDFGVFRESVFNSRIIGFDKVVFDILHGKWGLAYPRAVSLSSGQAVEFWMWRKEGGEVRMHRHCVIPSRQFCETWHLSWSTAPGVQIDLGDKGYLKLKGWGEEMMMIFCDAFRGRGLKKHVITLLRWLARVRGGGTGIWSLMRVTRLENAAPVAVTVALELEARNWNGGSTGGLWRR